MGDGNGWSRLTDGNLKSYWKSNPYLTKPFTGDEDSQHPQWVMIDLGAKVDVNAIRIAWAESLRPPLLRSSSGPATASRSTAASPRAPGRRFRWDGRRRPGRDADAEADELDDSRAIPAHLDDGIVQHLRHARRRGQAQLPRVRHQRTVRRHRVRDGQFTDIVKHLPSRQQTITWPSSVDPWHAASDLDYGRGDQIGLDFFFNCGVTRGLPAMIPVAVLYTIPEDAANEIAYLYKRKYPISWIEMGEEADGQRVLPEDYATLYIQFAKAIHKLVPKAPLGGPSFEGTPGDVDSWADANGRVSFLGRFCRLSEGSRPSPGLHLLFLRALSVYGRQAMRRVEFALQGTGLRQSRHPGLER